jgi:hypothetical protein
LDASHAEAIVFNLLLAEGDMLAFQRQAGFGDCILRAVVEYYDVDIAMGVLSKYNGFTIEVWMFLTLHRNKLTGGLRNRVSR